MDDQDQTPPEVTIEPADNGFVVRHHQRSTKKDQAGRTVRRVAASTAESLPHAGEALGGGRSKSAKKKSIRQDGPASAEAGEETSAPAAHSLGDRIRSRARSVRSARRRPRVSARRA